jgi:hypothetical protein
LATKGNNMRHSIKRLLAAFAGFLLLLAAGMSVKPASAQTNNARIDGTVLTSGGAPLTGVLVEVLNGTTLVASQGSVGGTISFPPLLPAGTFTLRSTLQGAGATPAVVVTQSISLTAGAVTSATVTVPSTLPVVFGRVTINGAAITNSSTIVLGGLNWAVNAGADFRSDPQTVINSVGLSSGDFSILRPTNGVFSTAGVNLTGVSPANSGHLVNLVKPMANFTPSVDTNLGTIDFAVAAHTMNFTNADASAAVGYLTVSGSNGVGQSHKFTGPISSPNPTTVLSLAVPSNYTVFPTASTSLPTDVRYASGAITPAAGGVTNVTLNNGPILSGKVLINGLPVALNTTATIGGMPWAVQGSLSAQMTAPSSLASTPRGWVPTTGNFAERFPVGTHRVRINIRLTGNGPSNTGLVVTLNDLRPGVVLNGNVDLGTIDLQLVNHTLALVNGDGSAGSGYVIANTPGSVNPSVDFTTAGLFYNFTGQVSQNVTTPMVAGSLNATVFPGTDTTVPPYVSAPITAVAGTTSTLTLNTGPVVRARMLLNGQPVGGSVTLGGTTWSTQGSGMSFQPVGTTTTPLATGLGLIGAASRRVSAGTYIVRAYINLAATAGSPATAKTLQYIKVIDNQALTADTDLGDIDFQTGDHTVRLVNRDGTAGSGNVQLTNLTGTASTPGSFVSFRGEVTGSFVVPSLFVPAQLIVRTPLTNAAILSSTSIMPSTGGLTTVVLGGAPNVTVTTGDVDGDGILDLLEASAPNQDVDGNGVLDHQQKNITSLPIAGSTSEYVSIAVDNTKTLTEVSTLPISSAAVAPPAGTSFPSGLVKFTIPVVPASSDVTVRMYVAPAIAAQLTGYAKYNVATQLWTQMPADRVTINATAGWLDVRLTDNGIGDDDPTVGKISDPGAPLIGSIDRKTGSAAPTVALVFAPIPAAVPTTTAALSAPVAAAPTSAPSSTPSTTVPVTVPASILVQTSTIPPAPALAAEAPVATVEPAYTGSTPAPLVVAALSFLLLGYLMFWATSHRGKAALKRFTDRQRSSHQ